MIFSPRQASFIIVLLAVLTIIPPYLDKTTNKKNVKLKEITLWRRTIRAVGPAAAYEALKEQYGKNPKKRHVYAHLFGEALFETKGASGISVCDQDLGYGCFHGLIAAAIKKRGLSIITRLDRECLHRFGKNNLGCSHGIGHGIFEVFGFDRLNEALDLCTSLSWKGKLGGCQSGVLMAYHFILRDDSNEISPRPAKEEMLFDPCETVSPDYRLACIHELTFWWSALFKTDWGRQAKLCSGFTLDDERKVCFWGLGGFAYRTLSENPGAVVAACLNMPDFRTRALCLSGGRSVQIDNGRFNQKDICSFNKGLSADCNSYADMIARAGVYSN